MSDENAHLREFTERFGANGQKPEDDGVPETEFGGGYEAAGIVGQGKALLRLHIIREPGPRVTMQYVGIDSHSEYSPGRFVVQFVGTKVWRVTVTGRNLWRVYDAITRHALVWIQQAMPGRDFEQEKGKAVITGISVEEVGEE
ncbi:hypothetical protein ACYOEI_04020 [Singulisphaera rosea]